MTGRTHKSTGPDGASGDGYARVDALAEVAREVDGLRRSLEPLAGTTERVDDLTRAVADLADTVTEALAPAAARPRATPAPSWLIAPTDHDAVARVLGELCTWLHRVYLRYGDAAGLPECWLWHPEVVEELLWLEFAWLTAYQGAAASVALAGDWHDRQRPGVVRRVKAYAGSCSRERHQSRAGWSSTPQGALPVPGVDACTSIAAWWAAARDQPAPEPPPDPSACHRDLLSEPGPQQRPASPTAANGARPW